MLLANNSPLFSVCQPQTWSGGSAACSQRTIPSYLDPCKESIALQSSLGTVSRIGGRCIEKFTNELRQRSCYNGAVSSIQELGLDVLSIISSFATYHIFIRCSLYIATLSSDLSESVLSASSIHHASTSARRTVGTPSTCEITRCRSCIMGSQSTCGIMVLGGIVGQPGDRLTISAII